MLSLTKEKRHIQPQNWLDKSLVSESAVKCRGKIMSCNRGLSCWSTRSEEERCKTTYYLCCLHLKLRINISDIAKLWNSAQHAASCTPKHYQQRREQNILPVSFWDQTPCSRHMDMCTAGCNDTVGEWKREKRKTRVSDLEVSAVTSV